MRIGVRVGPKNRSVAGDVSFVGLQLTCQKSQQTGFSTAFATTHPGDSQRKIQAQLGEEL
jgi:hypothetical protein